MMKKRRYRIRWGRMLPLLLLLVCFAAGCGSSPNTKEKVITMGSREAKAVSQAGKGLMAGMEKAIGGKTENIRRVEKQQTDARKNETKEWEEAYLSAYENYILNLDQNPGEKFPIKGYCLVDLNFDLVPELGVYYDSMGSMGAWFAYYGFDGKEVIPLFQTSVYTQILADTEEQEVFLFREMYLLSGNDNGLIGYVSRLKQENGMITYDPILSLSVDEGRVIEARNEGKELPDYSTEDEYLADETMNEFFFTEYWDQDGWQEISLAEYLERKRELIPDENKLVDLTEGEVCLLAKEQEDDEDKQYSWENWIPEEEKIHRLFEEWQKKQEETSLLLSYGGWNNYLNYHLLNFDYFGRQEEEWFSDLPETFIQEKANQTQGEFQEVLPGSSVFPRELVVEMEKVIYQSLDAQMEEFRFADSKEDILYFRTMEGFDAENFSLDLEEMKELFPWLEEREDIQSKWDAYREVVGNEQVQELYHVPVNGEDNLYLCIMDLGGSNGVHIGTLLEWTGEDFISRGGFNMQNIGAGKVIRYEEEYYYVFLEKNYDLKNYDGIRLHRLGEKMEEETLLIKYLPESYEREILYNSVENTVLEKTLEDYVESIWNDITSPGYLNQGQGSCRTYVGEEKMISYTDEKTGYEKIWYEMDFSNMGIPIYLEKTSFEPASVDMQWYLRMMFYVGEEMPERVSELTEAGTGYSFPWGNGPVLVQLWFKELEGKTYTFGMYHISDYNYVLDISLIEGRKITRIRTELLVPKRHFVLSQEISHAGMG